jgi:transcriptional regulator with XRE-family HTH domain
MDIDPARRAPLGERVKRRRLALSLSIDQAAEMGDRMSATTWTRVEQGKPVRELSYAAVDRVLRWQTGSCVGFLEDGAEPTELLHRSGEAHITIKAERPPSPREQELRLLREIRERVEELERLREDRTQPDADPGEEAG